MKTETEVLVLICSIIKPPAYRKHREIKEAIKDLGLEILRAKDIRYTAQRVDVLYDHMDMSAKALILARYGGRIGSALLIATLSIEACREAIGAESDPRACNPRSIRAKFGERTNPERFGSWEWWENAAHRPIDERERIRDLMLIFPEYVRR